MTSGVYQIHQVDASLAMCEVVTIIHVDQLIKRMNQLTRLIVINCSYNFVYSTCTVDQSITVMK